MYGHVRYHQSRLFPNDFSETPDHAMCGARSTTSIERCSQKAQVESVEYGRHRALRVRLDYAQESFTHSLFGASRGNAVYLCELCDHGFGNGFTRFTIDEQCFSNFIDVNS